MYIFKRFTFALPRFALALTVSCVLTLSAGGCVYRVPIQQGNLLETKDIEQVKVGMTQAQVRYVLGTPMVIDEFSKDRWDYIYYLKKGRMRTPEQRHFIVYFDNGAVARIEQHENTTVDPARKSS